MAKSEKKALTVLLRTVLLTMTVLCTLMFTGCPNMAEDDDLIEGSNLGSGNSGSSNSGGGSRPASKYAVEFGVDGANGTLTATVDGISILSSPRIKVEEGKIIVFTARPNENYIVDKWTIAGGTFEANTGQEGSLSAKVKVTAAVKVTVTFKAVPTGSAKYTVEHWHQNVEGNGYTKKDSENKTGTVGGQTQAAAKIYTGFTAKPSITQETIAADGSTAVKVYYDRKIITLTLKLDGGTIQPDNKLTGRFEAAVSVNTPTKAGYTFKGWTPDLPGTFPAEDGTYTAQWEKNFYTIKFTANGHGLIKADNLEFLERGDIRVEHGETVTFTARPNKNYIVDKWTITGGTFESGTGQEGSLSAKVTVKAADIKVSVSFKSVYKEVRYAELEAHLKKASDTDINYIEITDIQASEFSSGSWQTGLLGKKIQDAAPKKVALKLPSQVAGLTDMTSCFHNCTNLVSVENIPEGVTNLLGCFQGCTSLTKAPAIPAGVTKMVNCFNGCTSLTKAPVIPESVEYMELCFQDCTSLTQVPVIPAKVKRMAACFNGCTSLTQVSDIPASVTDMRWCFQNCTSLERIKLNCSYNAENADGKPAFTETFNGCTALKVGGIQVKTAHYAKYIETQALNTMKVPGTTEPDKKAKFSEF